MDAPRRHVPIGSARRRWLTLPRSARVEDSRRAGDRTMIALIEAGNATSVHLHERYGFTTVGTVPQAGEKRGQILDLTLISRSLQ